MAYVLLLRWKILNGLVLILIADHVYIKSYLKVQRAGAYLVRSGTGKYFKRIVLTTYSEQIL